MTKTKLTTVILALAAFTQTLNAIAESDLCSSPELPAQPVLADGRPMPLGLYAAKIRKSIFAKDSCREIADVVLYCRLSKEPLEEIEKSVGCTLTIRAEHIDTFKLIGLSDRSERISAALALSSKSKLLAQYHLLDSKGLSSTGPATDLGSLLTRIEKLEQILAGQDWKAIDSNRQWIPIKSYSDDVLKSAARLNSDESRLVSIETAYERLHPFALAIFICIAGFVFSLGYSKSRAMKRATAAAAVALIVAEGAGIAMRVLVSGRAPITNMFETVMWVGFGVFLLALILSARLKNPSVASAGFAGNAISLFMLNFSTNMLDGAIQPLVPVLRDNFWLSTHVTAVTSSYACFAFSWLLANFVLIKRILGTRSAEFVERWNAVIRMGMQIGTVFLAGGVLLGGIWADYSWGRFWGWDPKETWSLIALIVYIIILHGRYVGWFRGVRFTMMACLAFLSVIMAWFGVNYILAVGLHSYGFSSGGAAFIATLTAGQLAIVAASWLIDKAPSRKSV